MGQQQPQPIALGAITEDVECIWQVASSNIREPNTKTIESSAQRSESSSRNNRALLSSGAAHGRMLGYKNGIRRKTSSYKKFLGKSRSWLWRISSLLLAVEMIVIAALLVSRSSYYRAIMETEPFKGMEYDDMVLLVENKDRFNPAATIVDTVWRVLVKLRDGPM